MFQRLRRWFRRENNTSAPRSELDRASGEDAWETEDEESREATTPGTPRVKWQGGPT